MKLALLLNTCYLRTLILTLSVFTSAFAFSQPVANFSASPLSGCTPLVVTFSDQSTGAPTSWQWDLGNGTISAQQNPTSTYFNSGLYTISLTVSNASSSNTFTRTQYIKVDDKPTVDFTAPN